MKLSVLIPTRDRLEYLKLAVATVRRQDSADWEIVISDNASAEPVEEYIRSLDDERIRYTRSSEFLPVTKNWNAALQMSTGDYVLMLGDDDGLLPGYISRISDLLHRFDSADLIYTGSRVFTYPGVDPEHPRGHLVSSTFADFLGGSGEPVMVEHADAVAAVRKAMAFRLAFNFNMQVWLMSRSLIDVLQRQGQVYQSPFPDYYASCAALLNASRIIADPHAAVVIGVTKKSYGYFHVNERETEGREFLQGNSAPPQLPGTNINEGWLGAMAAIEANYGRRFGLQVNRRRYRLLQGANVYGRRMRGMTSASEVRQFESSLPAGERLLFRLADRTGRVLIRVLGRRIWRSASQQALHQFPQLNATRVEGRYQDILDVYAAELPR